MADGCGNWPITQNVEVSNWIGDGSLNRRVEPINVKVEFYGPQLDGDGARPDLCPVCKVEILRQAADQLESLIPATLPTIPGRAPEEA